MIYTKGTFLLKFLKGLYNPTNLFPLEGDIEFVFKDGYILKLKTEGLSTKASVPLDKMHIQSKIDFWEHQLNVSRNMPQKNEIDVWAENKAEKTIKMYKELIISKAQQRSLIIKGEISIRWVRKKPIIQIDFP